MIGSVPLGRIITQLFESIIILIPSETSEFENSSFKDEITLTASSEEHFSLFFVVKDRGNLEISLDNVFQT